MQLAEFLPKSKFFERRISVLISAALVLVFVSITLYVGTLNPANSFENFTIHDNLNEYRTVTITRIVPFASQTPVNAGKELLCFVTDESNNIGIVRISEKRYNEELLPLFTYADSLDTLSAPAPITAVGKTNNIGALFNEYDYSLLAQNKKALEHISQLTNTDLHLDISPEERTEYVGDVEKLDSLELCYLQLVTNVDNDFYIICMLCVAAVIAMAIGFLIGDSIVCAQIKRTSTNLDINNYRQSVIDELASTDKTAYFSEELVKTNNFVCSKRYHAVLNVKDIAEIASTPTAIYAIEKDGRKQKLYSLRSKSEEEEKASAVLALKAACVPEQPAIEENE